YPRRRGQEVVGAVVAFINITERKLAEAALANVSRRLIEAQEQERTRIGRELHDDISQGIAMLAIELEQLQESPPNLSDVPTRMGELRRQTSEIAADIQSLSHELHAAKLQYLGIAAAMRGFCQEFGEQQKAKIDFQTHDLASPLSPDISLSFFRVLKEGKRNVRRQRTGQIVGLEVNLRLLLLAELLAEASHCRSNTQILQFCRVQLMRQGLNISGYLRGLPPQFAHTGRNIR